MRKPKRDIRKLDRFVDMVVYALPIYWDDILSAYKESCTHLRVLNGRSLWMKICNIFIENGSRYAVYGWMEEVYMDEVVYTSKSTSLSTTWTWLAFVVWDSTLGALVEAIEKFRLWDLI